MLNRTRQANPMAMLYDEIARINGRIKSVFAHVNRLTGLSSMESTVLTAVVEARVAPTVPQIGRSLGHPRQVIQRAVTALVADGLIETAANPNHKRAPLLLPTRRGRALKQDADGYAIEASNALLRSLDREKCQRVAEDLKELRSGIEAYLRSGRAK